ncbi:MAG: nucleoside triphosphate pyrophosphohydrolase, partial [Acidobacteria bacterium]|nr:nucleoside triphosphate pyrophosphohydrolase [Acidobacteriota bacterium]
MSDSAGARFERLVQVMHTLRAPGGCPWDREQTLQTLRPFVLEETCELLDAIDAGDLDGIREELGDVVFEAVFVAELCAEAGHFSIADSVAAVTDKLIRRHPHIFDASGQPHGDTGGIDARGVKAQWDDIKDEERQLAGKAKKTMLSGIPRALPALLRAETMARKVTTVGFDWPNALEALDKVEEEIRELREALATGNTRAPEIEEELGDLFFALANVARKLDLSPEAALRKANDKFQVRWEAMEAEARSENRPLAG